METISPLTELSTPTLELFSGSTLPLLLMVIFLSVLAASAAMFFLAQTSVLSRADAGLGDDNVLSDGCVFVFSNEQLVFASETAQDVIGTLKPGDSSWSQVSKYLTSLKPEISPSLKDLIEEGTGFYTDFETEDGRFLECEGQARGGFLRLTLREFSENKLAHRAIAGRSAQSRETTEQLDEVLSKAPLIAWRRDKEGKVLWGNEPLHILSGGSEGFGENQALALPAAFKIPDDGTAIPVERRVAVTHQVGTEKIEEWYLLSEHEASNQEVIGFAIDAKEIVKVEMALGRFVATLTESFAHLQTGLAIFDQERRLTIFNPAIADLLQLDPGWLALGPGFRKFMSRVREAQMMPEHKTSAEWKTHVQTIEDRALNGSLSEKWVLPSGQTFKITGRPHPHGAIALMIDDISTRTTLERRYKSEIEQSRTTLDYLTEAICVFDTTGAMVYSNTAFAELWGFDPRDQNETPNILDLTKLWSEACLPTPTWGDLREFVTSVDQRASWTSDLSLSDGRILNAVFAPLPDGSTLTSFTHSTADLVALENTATQLAAQKRAHASEISIMELAIEHMQEAIHSLTKAVDVPHRAVQVSSPVEETVSYADRLLLMRRDQETAISDDQDGLSKDLIKLLYEKNAALNLSCPSIIEDGHLTPDLKRLLVNVMLVTRSLVASGENVDLSLVEMNGGLTVSCMFRSTLSNPTKLENDAGLPFRILMRFVKDKGGHGEINQLDDKGFVKISCTIPISSMETASPFSEVGGSSRLGA